MVQMTLCEIDPLKQKPRRREQMYFFQGGKGGCEELGDWD